MDFETAFARLIGNEGGYVNHPGDPGGETKYGISKRQYPGEDIKNLTLDRAKALYLRDYWGPAGCDVVPMMAKFQVFDMAVNSGVFQTIRTVQKVVGEVADGALGPRTLQAIQSMQPTRFVARFNGYRLDFMTDLKTWEIFGKGWARRIAKELKEV